MCWNSITAWVQTYLSVCAHVFITTLWKEKVEYWLNLFAVYVQNISFVFVRRGEKGTNRGNLLFHFPRMVPKKHVQCQLFKTMYAYILPQHVCSIFVCNLFVHSFKRLSSCKGKKKNPAVPANTGDNKMSRRNITVWMFNLNATHINMTWFFIVFYFGNVFLAVVRMMTLGGPSTFQTESGRMILTTLQRLSFMCFTLLLFDIQVIFFILSVILYSYSWCHCDAKWNLPTRLLLIQYFEKTET